MPLTAILALGAGPLEVGVLGAAQLVPIVIVGLPAGAWVDRLRSRRRVMVGADLCRGLLLASVPLAWIAGALTFGQLIVVVLATSALGTLFDVAIASYVPLVVGRDGLIRANSRLELSRATAAVIGPGAAAVVLRFLAAPIALGLDAMSFIASAVLVGTSPGDEPTFERPLRAGGSREVRQELLAGVRLALHEPHLRAIVTTAMTNNLSRAIGTVVIVLFLIRDAGASPDTIGLAFALGNTGFVVGALAASRVSAGIGIGRAMRLGVSLFWPGMLALGLTPANLALPVFTVMLFMNGLGIALHNVNQVSVRQAVTPDHLRARVAAATRLLILGAIPAGTLIGGLLGSSIGLQNTIVVAAFGLFLGSLPYPLSRVGSLKALPAETAG